MKATHTLILLLALLATTPIADSQSAGGSSDIGLITAALMAYIDGTANGDPELVRRTFHPDFNLYTVNDDDSLLIPDLLTYPTPNLSAFPVAPGDSATP